MKDATISELYDLTQTIAAKIFEGKTYPWEVLPLIKDFILELGETVPKTLPLLETEPIYT